MTQIDQLVAEQTKNTDMTSRKIFRLRPATLG